MTNAVRRKSLLQLIYVFLIFLLLVAFLPAHSQRVNVQSKIDKDEILIGEYINLSLNIYIPKGSAIQYPVLRNQQFKNFEIVESGVIDTVFNSNGSITLQQQILLTSFDSGSHVIPGIQVPYHMGDEYDTATASHLEVKVGGIAVDFSQDIKDIRPPVAVPFNWREVIPYLFYIISFLILLGGGVYAWIYYKKNNAEQDVFEAEIEPAHIAALRQLDTLKQENLLQKKEVKEFHNRLTDHIRRYIQNRFQIQAMEKTSDEILTFIKEEKVDQNSFVALEQILILADQVKFAKVNPSDKENNLSLNNAYYFVNHTKDINASIEQ